MIKHVFLTGPPGVGKSTLVQKACDVMTSSGVSVEGFYTQEVREGGRRVGFDVVTLTGQRGHLSRIRGVDTVTPPGVKEFMVGNYIVDLQSFEDKNILKLKLFIIDEVGRMELFSQSFIRAVRQTLDSSVCCVLGTIPLPKGKPLVLVEEIRARPDVTVFTVTKDNRDVILSDILSVLQNCLKQSL
uniref:Uncharacterized protein n=1 Tax=Esox lucius TaxID=8010 RepID=A0A3P9AEA3_ESOLU